MACSEHSATSTPADSAPGQYRELETPGDRPERWVHEHTGLVVELRRYARYRTAKSTGTPDHYAYRLVIRPNGSDAPGVCVDSTRRGFDYGSGPGPTALAHEWMREHPDGRFEGGGD